MKIALIATDFYKSVGGISHVLNSMCKAFENNGNPLYVFNKRFTDLINQSKAFKIRKLFNVLKKKKVTILYIQINLDYHK